jgi:Mg-chelatase subunit ChlD
MALLAAPAAARDVLPSKAAPVAPEARRTVDLVICLDTSGSMTGLIESAKQKLWAVVNELATARPRPKLRVALYHYGNSGLDPKTGWVKQLCPLTDDLDTVYGKLFALKTNGGTEYVARVVRAATNELNWNPDRKTLRIIFVAGNEPATQDEATFKLQDVCKAAVSKGIIVNTIFCGADATGRRTGWSDAAAWADGTYASIDQNRGTVVIATPYDKKLAELSAELNKTYIAYGAKGGKGLANQLKQDKNAGALNAPAAAQRASAKASGLYHNAAWDLVDALTEKKVDLAKIKDEELPEPMRKMTLDERRAHVETMRKQRVALQSQIKDLTVKRDGHVKKEMEAKGLDDKAALDRALRDTVRTQAEKAGFQFQK